eukprot:TRINITY_DN4113_c1_g1_i1.p1 TRINITY_DN4113_c1_g1~~TRINITY_DN4113_c1_g1_i1.p1  ORF type:complete len:330 (-),score=18.49 TRINITY_DN4113_c1_g1_i1:85-1074(-)
MKKLTWINYRLLCCMLVSSWVESQNTCPCTAYNFIEEDCVQFFVGQACPDGELMGLYTYPADVRDWPYVVSFQIDHSLKKGEGCFLHFCSGMLIGPNMVLSAAHCFFDMVYGIDEASVPIQTIYAAKTPPCRSFGSWSDKSRVPVKHVYIPHFWNRRLRSGDIAVVILDQEMEGPYVNLPRDNLQLQPHMIMKTCGYGAHTPEENHMTGMYNARRLYEADISYISEELCSFFLMVYGSGGSTLNYTSMFCAYNPGADTCRGDSGGPVVIKGDQPKDDILMGIISWGPMEQCESITNAQAPLVLVRVTLYLYWVEWVIQQNDIARLWTQP